MIHFLVLFNLSALAFGLWTLGNLWSRCRSGGLRGDLLSLRFHLADSLLMILGAVFAYIFVNISAARELQRLFAGLILGAMGLLMLTLPVMTWHSGDRPAGAGLRWFWRLAAAFTALQGLMLWFAPPELEGVFLALGFGPFVLVVVQTLAVGLNISRQPGRPVPLSPLQLGLYLVLGAITALEALYLNLRTDQEPYLALSLPLAYILTSLQLLKAPRSPEAAGVGETTLLAPALELPPDLLRRAGLSPREAEMAALILQGQSNKEMAATLGLSENTVRNHIYNLYQKLGVQKRMDLVRLVQEEKSPDR